MATPTKRQVGSATFSAPERYPERDDSADENTSLLNPGTTAGASEQDERLPVGQLLLLCFSRAVENMAFFSIFPYISQMIQDNGDVPTSDIGFYSGIVEGTLALTQTFSTMPWSHAADRIGRKPALVISLVGATFAVALFGMTKTITQMIILRCITGLFTGTMVTIRTMFGDISTGKTEAKIQSWFGFSGSLGIFLGPLLGGALANPASQYPAIFGGIAFFEKYPYALSSLAVAFAGAISALLNLFYLKETLKRPSAEISENENGSNASTSKDTMGDWDILTSKGVPLALFVNGLILCINFASSAIVPVALYTSVNLGGYGWKPHQISLMLALNGAAQTVWLVLVFPPLQAKIGTKGVMRLCSFIYPLYYACFPIGNFLLRQETKFCTTAFWVFFPLAVVVGSGGNMTMGAMNLVINHALPRQELRGRMNGLSMTLTNFLKTVCPVLFSTIFAFGARTQLAGGYAIWGVIISVALCYMYASKRLPESIGAK